jgi:hypothetical protein
MKKEPNLKKSYLIRSAVSNFLGYSLFQYDWYENMIGADPSIDDLFKVGLRAAVIRHQDFKFCVYSNDHPPPHFHVRSNGEDAAFSIAMGKRMDLKGNTGLKRRDEIIYRVWEIGRHDIANAWNNSRPTIQASQKFTIPPEWGPQPTEDQLKRSILDLMFKERAKK